MKKNGTRDSLTYKLTLYAILTAITVVLTYVSIPMPLGLHITFNLVPVVLAGFAMGPIGGAVMGGIFGLISFLQCFGIIGPLSMQGSLLVGINPYLTFIQRFIPRVLMGYLAALIYRLMKKKTNEHVSFAVTGMASAFLNTLLFMTFLVILFGEVHVVNTDAGKNLITSNKGFFVYIVTEVGLNAVVELIVTPIVTGAVGAALRKARLI